MYYQIYDLLSSSMYGDIALTSFQELVLTQISTYFTLFVHVIPIAVVWWSCKFISSLGMRR